MSDHADRREPLSEGQAREKQSAVVLPLSLADPDQVLALAHGFLGTPYRHQGSRAGVGCDCLGLVRGVWRGLFGAEPESVEPYRPDWYAHDRRERLFQAAERHLVARPCAQPEPGDVVLFRFRAERPATHCGIAGVSGSLIHAYERSAVIVSVLPDAWRRRIAGIFAFPAYPKS